MVPTIHEVAAWALTTRLARPARTADDPAAALTGLSDAMLVNATRGGRHDRGAWTNHTGYREW